MMEALTADDSSGANPSSIKSDDSSPRHDGGRGSPPPNCAICLGTCRNKSFTDSCLHQFCFKCLLTWSKVKAECPLCKQVFKSIIHNVRSNHQYDEYTVETRHEETTQSIDIDYITPSTRRFRYRTTLTLPRRETLAIQQLLMEHYPLVADVFPPPLPAPRPPPPARRRSPAAFRRTVYRHNLWARPLPDFTGRFRDCTPDFYRYNDSQMHRLVPWLQRELSYLLNENIGHISYVMTRILELLPRYHINSPEFREAMQRYFGERTEHFLHELYCFASTPYDMTGYDRNVQYTTDSRISTMVNEVISSSESEASVDSDIVMVSSSYPAATDVSAAAATAAAAAGPSRVRAPLPVSVPSPIPAPEYPRHYIPDSVIPIETISHSDSDSEDDVLVVGYIKPPAERTPEVVDLIGSDSDVVLNEPQPEPSSSRQNMVSSAAGGPAPTPTAQRPLVKLSLKRRRGAGDAEWESCLEAPAPAARRPCPRPPHPHPRRSRYATTSDTSRTTPSPSYSPAPSASSYAPSRSPTYTPSPVRSPTPSPARSPTPSPSAIPQSRSITPSLPRSISTRTSDWNTYSDSSSSDQTYERRRRLTKKKSKRKTRRDSERKKTKRSRHSGRSSSKEESQERRSKRKSHSGKGVKSSKRNEKAETGVVTVVETNERSQTPPLAAGAGASAGADASEQPGPSGARARVRAVTRSPTPPPPAPPRHRQNCKRLKSVVNVMYKTDSSPGSSTLASQNSPCSSNRERLNRQEGTPPLVIDETRQITAYSDTDSDDNLPLNLSMQKILGSVVEKCSSVPLCDVLKCSHD